MLFYRVQKACYSSSYLIQTYGNICDTPGEYHSNAMLVMPPHVPLPCMPLPVVAHQRNKYYVVLKEGRRHLSQRNVYVEDFGSAFSLRRRHFRLPTSSLADATGASAVLSPRVNNSWPDAADSAEYTL